MKKLSALVALSLCAAPVAYAQNGGTTCATATTIVSNTTYTADTTAAPNWIINFGPLVSPSNDVVYTFVAPADTTNFSINPTASNYAFALYLIPSCAAGAGPTPIGSTAVIGSAITPANIAAPGLQAGNTYYLAATGTAAGGPTANGTVTFNAVLPVTLQSFEID
jgi:hypothetical protein